MLIVSEQQTFAKLQLPPKPFDEMTEDEVIQWVTQLQGEREKTAAKKAKTPKDPNAPKQTRGKKATDINFGDAG